MEGVSSKTEVSDKNREQIKQDVLFVRLFLEQMSQTRVLRWREEGEKPFVSAHEVRLMNEPDAEHTGQMYALTNDVLDKAVAEGDESFHDFDIMLALRMIGMHDMEESITGDVRQKDEAHHKNEEEAVAYITERVSELNFGNKKTEALELYRKKSVKEARFVKAIDELQAWFYLIHTRRFEATKSDFENPETIKGYAYSEEFPTLRRIMNVVLRIMRNPESVKSGVPEMELLKTQYE